MNKAALRRELMELSPAERLELVEELWESLTPDDLPPLSERDVQAIEEELAAHESDPTATVTWEELRAELRSRGK